MTRGHFGMPFLTVLGVSALLTFNVACGDDAGTGATGAGGDGAGGSGAGGSGAGGDGAGATGATGGSPNTIACDHEPGQVGDPIACNPAQFAIRGDLDGKAIDESFVRGFGLAGGSTFSEVGTFGLLYFPAVEAQLGETTSLRGLLRFPDESSQADDWYCLGSGTEVTLGVESYTFTGTLDSLSLLGSCENATPVTGEITACFTAVAEGCTSSNVVSTVSGASFDVELAGGYLGTHPKSDVADSFWVFAGPTFEQTGLDVGGAIRFDASNVDLSEINVLKTATLERGFLVVPPGVDDEGAVYCIGTDSKVEYQAENDGVFLSRGTFRNLKRIGKCPAENSCVEGNLQVCAN